MEVNTGTAPFYSTPISREELVSRLEVIAEKDQVLAALFASRCALRVMPYLAVDGRLGSWSEQDQAHNMAALWFAATLVYSQKESRAESASGYAAFNAFSLVSAIKSQESSYIVDAASSAAGASAYFGSVASFAADAAIAAYNAASLTTDLSFDVEMCKGLVEDDLIVLEGASPQSLFAQPLWLRGSAISKEIRSSWKKVLATLVDDARKNRLFLADFLSVLPEHYNSLLAGNYSRERATALTQELCDYFEPTASAETKKAIKSKPATKKAAKAKRPSMESLENVERVSSDSPSEQESLSSVSKTEYRPSNTFASEQPSNVDHLGRVKVCAALAAVLADPKNHGHQTIGLLGDWGSGKSTWINLLTGQLQKHQDTQPFIVSTFNAWSYESTPNLQAGVAHELIKTLVAPPREKGYWGQCWWNLRLKSHVAVALHGWQKMFWVFARFLIAIIPFTILWYMLPAGSSVHAALATASGFAATLFFIYKSCAEQIKTLWAEPRAQELLTYLKLPSYAKHLGEIPEMRKTLETFCKVRLEQMSESSLEGGHTRLLVVVDDLDRCGHQQIVKVFEAVRLVLEIEHVTVVIAVDQHIALAALALHYKDLASHHKLANPRAIARDYLAKVIHLPITICPPDDTGVASMLNDLWNTAEVVDAPFEQGQTDEILVLPNAEIKIDTVNDVDQKTTEAEHSAGASIVENQNAPTEPAVELSDQKLVAPQPVAMPAPLKVKALSSDHKTAFLTWVRYFGLVNPRQLKRLNNTYTLILNANSQFDNAPLAVATDFGNAHESVSFPVLIALITIEYLNSLDNADLRKRLKARLQGRDDVLLNADEAVQIVDQRVHDEFIIFFRALDDLVTPLRLFAEVEPFVLPAIECDLTPKRPLVASNAASMNDLVSA